MNKALSVAQEKFEAKQKSTKSFYDGFKTDDGLKMTQAQVEEGQAMNKELKSLYDELSTLKGAEEGYKTVSEFDNLNGSVARIETNPNQRGAIKTLGDSVIENDGFKSWKPGTMGGYRIDIPTASIKTLMSLTAGFSNPNDRTRDVVPFAIYPNIIQDYIPSIDTDVDIVKYMEMTTRTNNAAGAAEGAALAENAKVWTERSVTVELIGAQLPVTEQQLEVPELMMSTVNDDLMLDYRLAEEAAILNGTGSSPQLQGITTKSGIQTQAKGADATPTAAYKLLTTLRYTGVCNPDLFLFNPTDWQDVKMLQATTGFYIFGSPADASIDRLWGCPVVQTPNVTVGTAIAGDFRGYARIYRRRGAMVEIGYQNDDFGKNRRTIKVTGREAFVMRRAGAFGTLTGV